LTIIHPLERRDHPPDAVLKCAIAFEHGQRDALP
jgi:hypothetical protein